MRTEPARSVPRVIAPQPLATAAAPPPVEPPGVRLGSHGLRVTPQSPLSVVALEPSSGMVVIASTMPPACRRRSTATASRSGTLSR